MRELQKFAPSLTIAVHRGADRSRLHRDLQRSQVVITTYDTAVNDLVLFRAVEWSWMVLDEAQAVKNPDSRRRSAVATIPRQRTIPVTGTPVENHLLDLWSLADLAVPGLLGSRDVFELRFPDTDAAARALSRDHRPGGAQTGWSATWPRICPSVAISRSLWSWELIWRVITTLC